MARVETITLISDLDKSPADVTVTFGVDGKVRHIDLSHEQANQLRDLLQPYLAVSRPASNGTGGNRAAKTARTADAAGNAAVRAWARKQGVELADRGRIPRKVLDAYAVEHGAA